MKLLTIFILMAAAGAHSTVRADNPNSAYANAYLELTSSNDSELATASANTGAGFAEATAQPGLLGNSILASATDGSAASYQNQTLSGFSDQLTINGPGMTGSDGTLLFHFLVNGLEYFGSTTAPADSSITTAATFASTGSTGTSDALTFTKDSDGAVTGGSDFLGISESVLVPFVFGTPFTISLNLEVTAIADNSSGGGIALVSGSFSTTASTDSVTALAASGPVLAGNFSAYTASGADYFGTSAVPEPDGLFLMVVGLVAFSLLRTWWRIRSIW